MYEPAPMDYSHIALGELERLVEPLAFHNHEVWARQRIAEGWRWAPQHDDTARRTPKLVPYGELPDTHKEDYRETARQTLRAILGLGVTLAPAVAAPCETPAAEAGPRLTLEKYRADAGQAVSEGECLTACDIADEGLRFWPADTRLRQLHALALARMGSHVQARSVITGLAAESQDEETLGILARTYKDLWLESDDPSDLDRAYQAYASAYKSHPERYWTGINAATLAVARGDRAAAFHTAADVGGVCIARLDSATDSERYWLTSTLAEAALVQGDLDEAARRYAEASAVCKRDLGNLSSTLRNARIILRHLPDDAADRIEAAIGMPGVAVFSGHRTDLPGRPRSRFPASAAPAVADSIRAHLVESGIRVGYSSAAAGGDILFLEALKSIGGRIHVVLPCSREQFIAESVLPCGTEWVPRFHRVMESATEVLTASEEHLTIGSIGFDYGNQLLYGLALSRAEQFGVKLHRIAVWDGSDGSPAGTGDVVAMWRSEGHSVRVIDPRDAGIRVVSPQPGMPLRPPDSAPFSAVTRSMIFADAHHFSKLSEAQMPDFIDRFVGLIASLVEAQKPPALFQNTWGDGLFLVFEKAAAAGRFAIRLAKSVAAIDRAAAGLPATLNLRIAIHVGPVYRFQDRIVGRPNYIGAHVNRTARIEPITPPGQVYGTHAFTALAALEAPGEFRCDYVGRLSLAKKFGEFAMYRVQAARQDM